MSTINGILKNSAGIVNDGLNQAAQNSAKANINPLYIGTEVSYTDNKFGQTSINLRAKIDQDLTNEYIKLLAQTNKSETLAKYSKDAADTLGQPTDAFALNTLFNKVNTALNDMQKLGSNNAVKTLNDFTKKLNTIHKEFQEQRGKADLAIQETVTIVNQLLTQIRQDNLILLENQHNKNEQTYVDTQKRIWEATTELAKYFSISTKTIEDGTQEINIVADKEIYNLVGRSTATEFFYKSEGASKIQADEPFNGLVLRKLGSAGKNLYAVDDFVVVSSGRNSSDTTYKIADGVIGGLLEARDIMLPEMINEINEMAATVMKKFNTMHNDMTTHGGLSVLTGSKSFNLDTTIAAQGKAVIALVDEHGKSLKYENSDFIPLELDMSELDHGTGQTNIQSIITKINDYFSAENQRFEVSGIHDVKLVSKSKTITSTNSLELGVEVTNAMQDSETGIKITNLKVTNIAGTEIRSTISNNQTQMIPAGSRQKLVNGLSISIDNGFDLNGVAIAAPQYPYTVEMILETQSIQDEGPIKTKVTYQVNDPSLYTNAANGILGKSFSVKKAEKVDASDIKFGYVKTTNMNNTVQASLIDFDGNSIVAAGTTGLLQLRTNSEKYKIAILQVDDNKMSGQAANMDEKMTAGFSEFFGLNDLFKPRDAKKLQNYKDAAKDIAIREDILKNSKLFSYSTLTLNRKDGENNDVVSSYETSIANYKIEKLWPDLNKTINNDIANLISYTTSNQRHVDSLHENYKSLKNGIEERLNTVQGVDDNELKFELFKITKMQESLATSFAAVQKLWEVFINRI